jgi:hypothetical protein
MSNAPLHLQLKDLVRALQSVVDGDFDIKQDAVRQTLILSDEGFDITFTVELINNSEYLLSFPIAHVTEKYASIVESYLFELMSQQKLMPRRLKAPRNMVSYGVALSFRWHTQDTHLASNFYHALERLRVFKEEFYDEFNIFLIEEGVIDSSAGGSDFA